MYKRILCPIDGSATSNCGLNEAIKLAKNQDAKLYLLHVIEFYVPMTRFMGESDFSQVIQMMNKNGVDLLIQAEKKAAALQVKTHLVAPMQGPIYESIINYAKECQADIIVMGTHGQRGLKRFMMGSDAEAVIRVTPVPVLLVKNQDPVNDDID